MTEAASAPAFVAIRCTECNRRIADATPGSHVRAVCRHCKTVSEVAVKANQTGVESVGKTT